MESKNRQYEHAFAIMTLDIVENVLRRPENISEVASHLMARIRELSGARTIMMFQYLQETIGTYTHRLLGVNPERTRALSESADILELIMISRDLPEALLVHPAVGRLSDNSSGSSGKIDIKKQEARELVSMSSF